MPPTDGKVGRAMGSGKAAGAAAMVHTCAGATIASDASCVAMVTDVIGGRADMVGADCISREVNEVGAVDVAGRASANSTSGKLLFSMSATTSAADGIGGLNRLLMPSTKFCHGGTLP